MTGITEQFTADYMAAQATPSTGLGAAVVVSTAQPNTLRWYSDRQGGIGASEWPTVCGLNAWATPLDVWLRKTGRDDGDTAGEAAEWGHRLQSAVTAKYMDSHPGVFVETPEDDGIPSIVAHPDYPMCRASLDAVCHDGDATYVLEIKTAGARKAYEWDGGLMPAAYIAQVLYQLAVTGLPFAHVAVLIAGQKYEERVIEADQRYSAWALNTAAKWWADHVVADVEPPIDLARDRDLLPKVWTPAPGRTVTIPDDLVTRLRDTRAAAAAAKTDAEMTAAEVKALMAAATVAVDGTGEPVAKWPATSGITSIDTAALKADLPDVAATYMRTGKPGRRFTVNG